MKNILIIGGGNIGQAVRSLFTKKEGNDYEVKIFDVDSSRSDYTELTPDIKQEVDHVYICVPSTAIVHVLRDMDGFSKEVHIHILTKGFLPGTSVHTFEEFLQKGFRNVHVVYGPMLAKEVMERETAYATLATATGGEAVYPLEDTRLQTDTAEDIEAVAVAGILKNIYAIALGAIYHTDSQNIIGGAISNMTKEARDIFIANNLQDVSLDFCFLGDVIATGTSIDSSNYGVGKTLGAGEVCDLNSEGCRNIEAFISRYAVHAHTPIVHAVKSLLDGGSYEAFKGAIL